MLSSFTTDMKTHTPTSKKKSQIQRREETRQRVLDSACRLFGGNGYASTSLRDVAADAGLTISPIYHYFESKLQLFVAVNELMEQRLINMLEASFEKGCNIAVQQGWDIFLQACKTPGFVQIVLVDSPHVLGHERWKESPVIAKAYELFTLHQARVLASPALQAEAGVPLSELDQELIMRMSMAALAEAALMVGRNPDYDSSAVVSGILNMLKP